METWSLPKARPISCNDCPAFQRPHMSIRWFAESFTRFLCATNTTFQRKDLYQMVLHRPVELAGILGNWLPNDEKPTCQVFVHYLSHTQVESFQPSRL